MCSTVFANLILVLIEHLSKLQHRFYALNQEYASLSVFTVFAEGEEK